MKDGGDHGLVRQALAGGEAFDPAQIMVGQPDIDPGVFLEIVSGGLFEFFLQFGVFDWLKLVKVKGILDFLFFFGQAVFIQFFVLYQSMLRILASLFLPK